AEQAYAAGDGRREGAPRSGQVFTTSASREVRIEERRPILEVDRVSKRYRSRRGFKVREVDAVIDVSFTLREGTVTALVGQSGSGKSTLARLVTGVERPTSGEVRFGDVRVDRL